MWRIKLGRGRREDLKVGVGPWMVVRSMDSRYQWDFRIIGFGGTKEDKMDGIGQKVRYNLKV